MSAFAICCASAATKICCSRWTIRIWKRSFPLVMERLAADADAIRDGMARSVVRNLKTMARMGVFLERAVHRALSGISGALGRAQLGRISSAARARISNGF